MGRWRWRPTVNALARVVSLALPVAFFLNTPALANNPPPVFWLDPAQAAWLQLPQTEDLATLSVDRPAGGACDRQTWPNLFTNRLKVFEFPREITKTATPLTNNIRTVTEGTEFQVPVGQAASWRVSITVVNTSQWEITGVTVKDNFGAEYAVDGVAPSQGTVQKTLSGAAQKVHLSWTIGALPAGGTAVLEFTASLKLNPSGRQEYTSPGIYQLNSGAELAYDLPTGGRHSVKSNTIQVTAVSAGAPSVSVLSASRIPSLEPLKPTSLTTTPLATAERTAVSLPFTEEFQPLTPVITPVPAQYGYPSGFEVPEDLRVEWRVVLTVRNTLAAQLTGVVVTEHLGAELWVDRGSIAVSPDLADRVPAGAPSSTVEVERLGNDKVTWTISRLGPGEEATLSFTIYTRVKEGRQAYADPTPPPGPPNFLNSGAVLKYPWASGQVSVELPGIPVWVKEGGFLRVTLSGTRYDWQIRKPGSFTAGPVQISVYSNRLVTLTFSGFADLASLPGGSEHLPTYYAFSETRPGTALSDWIRAAELDDRQQTTTAAQVGTTVTWVLWPRLETGPATRAGDYEDVATLTFTLREAYPHVVTGGGSNPDLLGEVKWLGPTELELPAR